MATSTENEAAAATGSDGSFLSETCSVLKIETGQTGASTMAPGGLAAHPLPTSTTDRA